ncbi:MAG: response regulator [Rhodospirillales bacterium]
MACVLLVDDDDLILETLTLALTDNGYDVVTASDGDDALSKFEQNDVAIVVTDIIMPNKEGVETILQFRQVSPDLPIIAMTGGGRSGRLDFLSVATKLGATDTLKKPFSPDELIAAVHRALNPAG